MMNLDEKKLSIFKVEDLFRIEQCKCSRVSSLSKGNFPYVGATNRNNGVLDFVEYDPSLRTEGNCIVFICDGQGSVGYSIYKKEDFIGSTTLKVGRNPNLNSLNSLFITTALDKNKTIYDYGYKRNLKRLKNEFIYLPVADDGKPDWEYMEEYAKELETRKLEKYLRYLEGKIEALEYVEIDELEDKEWEDFFLNDVFTSIRRGKRLTKANQSEGMIPYISSTAINNGVDNFIEYKSGMRKYENCLSLANSGSVGACFYEPYEFIASDHITHLKNDDFNQYIYLFISTILNRLSDKYNFNREINDKRLSRERVLLPIDDEGNPDYDYMEQFAKNLMLEKYNKYINYISKRIS